MIESERPAKPAAPLYLRIVFSSDACDFQINCAYFDGNEGFKGGLFRIDCGIAVVMRVSRDEQVPLGYLLAPISAKSILPVEGKTFIK